MRAGHETPIEGAIAAALARPAAAAMVAPSVSPIAKGKPSFPEAHGLTRRELEVLRLLATGAKDRQVAEALFVSQRTVSTHVSRILDKLGVASRGEAAMLAAGEGLV